ncbi:MAG TPA: histidine kinase, partial [Bacteroidetes bacterium]|nr:histidine kinase [Bacteroidota bacterium]
MRIFKKWLLLVCLSCTALPGSGQRADSFQHLSKKDGLSQVSVFAIAQDSAGFMWFGTKDGLNKYDGYQFKVYKKNASANSLVANDIRTLYVGSNNNELWIGTTTGLSKYQPTSDNFINYLNIPSDTNSISGNVIRQIFEDSKGRLWVGTSVGLNLFDRGKNNFKRLTINNNAPQNIKAQDVKAILEDSQGQLWFGTANGLFKLIENKGNIFSF